MLVFMCQEKERRGKKMGEKGKGRSGQAGENIGENKGMEMGENQRNGSIINIP